MAGLWKDKKKRAPLPSHPTGTSVLYPESIYLEQRRVRAVSVLFAEIRERVSPVGLVDSPTVPWSCIQQASKQALGQPWNHPGLSSRGCKRTERDAWQGDSPSWFHGSCRGRRLRASEYHNKPATSEILCIDLRPSHGRCGLLSCRWPALCFSAGGVVEYSIAGAGKLPPVLCRQQNVCSTCLHPQW